MPPDENIEVVQVSDSSRKFSDYHTIVIKSLRVFAKLLKKFPKLSFFALTLLIEYYLLQLGEFIHIFKKVIYESVEIENVDFWLGNTKSKINYNSYMCSPEEKANFIKTLKEWSKLLPTKPTTPSEMRVEWRANGRNF